MSEQEASTFSMGPEKAVDTLKLAVTNENLNIAQRALAHVIANGNTDAIEPGLLFGLIRLVGGLNSSGTSAKYRLLNTSNAHNPSNTSESTLNTCLSLLRTHHPNGSLPPDVVHMLLERSLDNDDLHQFDTLWSTCKAASDTAPRLANSTYIMIMEAYSQRGLLDKVIEVFHCFKTAAAESAVIAKQSKLRPVTKPLDDTAYLILIDAHLKHQPQPNLHTALDIFHKMIATANPSPTLPIFNRLINATAKNGDYDTVNLLFSMLTSANLRPDHNTYNALTDAYAKAGDEANMQKVLQEWREDVLERTRMAVRGGSKLPPPTIVNYNTLMSMLAKSNSVSGPEDADALLKIMTQDGGCGINQITVTSYLCVFERRGLYTKVRDTFYSFERVYGVPPSTDAYNVLLSCYARSRNTANMRKVVDEMRYQKGLQLNQRSYWILVRGFASALDVDGVLEWMKELSDPVLLADGGSKKLKLELQMVESLAWAIVKKEKFNTSKQHRVADVLKANLAVVTALNGDSAFHSTALADIQLEALIADLWTDDAQNRSGWTPVPFKMEEILDDAGFSGDTSGMGPSAKTLKLVVEVIEKKLKAGAFNREASRISALASLKRVTGAFTVSGDLTERIACLRNRTRVIYIAFSPQGCIFLYEVQKPWIFKENNFMKILLLPLAFASVGAYAQTVSLAQDPSSSGAETTLGTLNIGLVNMYCLMPNISCLAESGSTSQQPSHQPCITSARVDSLPGFSYFFDLAARLAIEHVNNNPGILPGIRVGYRRFSNCGYTWSKQLEVSYVGDSAGYAGSEMVREILEDPAEVVGTIGVEFSRTVTVAAEVLSHYQGIQISAKIDISGKLDQDDAVYAKNLIVNSQTHYIFISGQADFTANALYRLGKLNITGNDFVFIGITAPSRVVVIGTSDSNAEHFEPFENYTGTLCARRFMFPYI
ncbi:hypothetical protein HDU81_007253 [Chytriomyces hyalinus]|nr:hypothetical protein HDU81_007253 [Chytriomyces hyalinus]